MTEYVFQLADLQDQVIDILEIVGYFVAAILGLLGGKAHERRRNR
jgi:hypothetical protein